VVNGLKADDWIVLNPADSLVDGQEVHVKEVPNPLAPAPAQNNAPANPSSPKAPAAREKKS